MNLWKHLKTITYHKYLVMKGCFKIGLYWQGILHDLSKYMPSEFFIGVKYYQGTRSPNNAEREDIGYSSAWLHHKGRNKHHYEYWVDYSASESEGMVPAQMPLRYVAEMFVDRVSASKVYRKDAYSNKDPLKYYEAGKSHIVIHPKTRDVLEKLLNMLATEGENKTNHYIKYELLKRK